MKSYLDKLFILEGILLAIIGVLFFLNPVDSFFNFTELSGIIIIVAGIIRIIRSFGTDSKMYYILTGIIDIIFCIIVYYHTYYFQIFYYILFKFTYNLYPEYISITAKTIKPIPKI